jgi:hypothetical protein
MRLKPTCVPYDKNLTAFGFFVKVYSSVIRNQHLNTTGTAALESRVQDREH